MSSKKSGRYDIALSSQLSETFTLLHADIELHYSSYNKRTTHMLFDLNPPQYTFADSESLRCQSDCRGDSRGDCRGLGN